MKSKTNPNHHQTNHPYFIYICTFLTCILVSFLLTLLLATLIDKEGVHELIHKEFLPYLPNSSHSHSEPSPTIYTLTPPKLCLEIHPFQSSYADTLCRNLLPSSIQQAFQNDGVVAIRGLLSPSMISSLDHSSSTLVQHTTNSHRRRKNTQFHTQTEGPIFLNSTLVTPFQTVALHSLLPQIASELLNLTTTSSLYVLRDIFLAKDHDPHICNWHIDDPGFWPANSHSTGIHAWIALDDMPLSTGGGFALSAKSHVASWRHNAYQAIGSVHTYPEEGYVDARDLVEHRVGGGTCTIDETAPELYERLERNKRVYPVRKGDVLFHHRWVFHRTVPFRNDIQETAVYRRYTVRYAPGNAVLPKGYGTELSLLWNESLGGKTVEVVSEEEGPWYPKCWPYETSGRELEAMRELGGTNMMVAQERRMVRRKEMKELLRLPVTRPSVVSSLDL